MNAPAATLHVYDAPPPGLKGCEIGDLEAVLPGPSLIHIEGEKKQPVFLSILLHGNETVGFDVLQNILGAYPRGLPRSISVFIGNIAAAARGLRRLPGQADYNRVWPSPGIEPVTPEHRLMRQLVAEMERRGPFASIDLHNNSGLNPHYACINRLDQAFFYLASRFSRTVVYFLRPQGVQSMAFAAICPAVTLECGRVGDAAGIEHATRFIDTVLRLDRLPEGPIGRDAIQLYHTVAIVKVPAETSFGFGGRTRDLNFVEDLEYFNFRELAAGTIMAHYHPGTAPRLEVTDENGRDVERQYLRYDHGVMRLGAQVMPAMLTLNEEIVRQDCLCYFMERYPLPGQP